LSWLNAFLGWALAQPFHEVGSLIDTDSVRPLRQFLVCLFFFLNTVHSHNTQRAGGRMACFDHFPILISQLVLRTHEDHNTVNAEEPVPLLSSRTLAYKTNHQKCAIWIGRTVLARAMLYSSSR
jgi:hypothetical protein